MRALAPALAFLSLLVAGCVTPPEVHPPPPTDAPRVLAWDLDICQYVVGWSDADPAVLRSRLPEGFTVGSGSLFGVVETPTTILGTEAFVCEGGAGLDSNVSGMQYGSFWFPVVPGEAHAIEGIDVYYWKEDVLVPDQGRLDLLTARGLPVHGGRAALGDSAAPLGQGGTLTLDGVGDVRLSLELPQAASAPTDTFAFAELTPAADGGIAVWRANYTWEADEPFAQGRGTIAWPAGSWAAEAAGAPTTSASFHAGTWSFHGTLTLPAP